MSVTRVPIQPGNFEWSSARCDEVAEKVDGEGPARKRIALDAPDGDRTRRRLGFAGVIGLALH